MSDRTRGPKLTIFNGAKPFGRVSIGAWAASLVATLVCLGCLSVRAGLELPVDATGLGYTNYRLAEVPWSIHVVQVPRTNGFYQLHSIHAGKGALGLDVLSDQVPLAQSTAATPIAAINGDFYQRDRGYAGAPRGLQVIDGELISAPGHDISFWIDAEGEAHADKIESLFRIFWPDGTSTPFGLNSERSPNRVELYTPAIGRSTHTWGGRELILGRVEGSPWLPLHVGMSYRAVVREIRDRGDTPLTPDTLVLSLGPGAVNRLPAVTNGSVLRVVTLCEPVLHGVRTAIGGGPLLVHAGRPQRPPPVEAETYEYTSMFERHPRAAIGWSPDSFFLVEVDGRQRGLSVGMTLQELGRFMARLGCQEAMNFDGGGSATLWFDGEVRNSPADRAEREIANCLVFTKEPGEARTKRASNRP